MNFMFPWDCAGALYQNMTYVFCFFGGGSIRPKIKTNKNSVEKPQFDFCYKKFVLLCINVVEV